MDRACGREPSLEQYASKDVRGRLNPCGLGKVLRKCCNCSAVHKESLKGSLALLWKAIGLPLGSGMPGPYLFGLGSETFGVPDQGGTTVFL